MKKKYQLILCYTILSALFSSNLSADTVHITMPKVPTASKVNAKVISPVKIVIDGELQESNTNTKEVGYKKQNRPIGFSKRVPPNTQNTKEIIGDMDNSKISTFLELDILPIDEIKNRLKRGGFSILAEYTVDKKGLVTSIVFTNPEISKAAAKNSRGFAGTLRVLVNQNSKKASITNPVYLLKAFMQADYDKRLAAKLLQTLHSTFENLKTSKDVVKFSKLDHYRYMDNMPYYQDMEVIVSDDNSKLLQRAHNSKQVVYEQKLANGSTVIGVKLSPRTSKFVKKIGYQNAGLLPYPILIEGNKAKILSPQYYIALMYPELSMTQFMSIASIPGAIVKDCSRVFR